MRKANPVGTHNVPDLEAGLAANRNDLVETLLRPHPQLSEMKGAQHKITATVAAQTPDAQPVQARGHVVWNKASSDRN